LNSQVYKEKILVMLQDENTYENIKKDPTNLMTKSVREMLTRWEDRSYITSATYKKIYCSDGNLPRAYGLPQWINDLQSIIAWLFIYAQKQPRSTLISLCFTLNEFNNCHLIYSYLNLAYLHFYKYSNFMCRS
jgi:hypothetical protein